MSKPALILAMSEVYHNLSALTNESQAASGFSAQSFWFGVVTSLVAGIILAFALAGLSRGFRPTLETVAAFFRLYWTLSSIRLARFTRSRADYKRHRKTGRTISNYIATANSSLKVVSFSFITGIHFEGVAKVLQNLLERDSPVEIAISLLDPREKHLIRAIASSYGVHSEAMCQDIFDGIDKLFDLKENLRSDCRGRLHIHVHRVIPFGSAILIDTNQPTGTIQIETKGYKCNLESSWGFELRAGGRHTLYRTLVDAYENLIRDSEELQSRLVRQC